MANELKAKRRSYAIEHAALLTVKTFLENHTGLKVSNSEAVNWAMRQCAAAIRTGKVTELGMRMPKPLPNIAEVDVDELSVPEEDEPTLVRVYRKRGTIGKEE